MGELDKYEIKSLLWAVLAGLAVDTWAWWVFGGFALAYAAVGLFRFHNPKEPQP